MKIVLTAINAKYIHSNLAIFSLRASAGKYKENVKLLEFTINHQKDDILEKIYLEHPDVLCISCYIWNLEYVEAVIREYHKIAPAVPIWLGGPEVSYETEQFMEEHPEVTGIMVGEGENTFRELCAAYDQIFQNINRKMDAGKNDSDICDCHSEDADELLRSVAGIVFRTSKNGVEVTSMRSPMDMSEIPFCYDTMEDFSNRIIYYESSRGCPFSCSYCLSSIDKRLRFRDLNLVKQELQFFIDQKVPQIKFVDRTFNCNHAHAMAIWQFVKERDNGITNFHFEVSADLLNEEEIQLISTMRPGLIQLEIGVQSTNEVTIREIHRTMRLERLKEVVLRIQEGKNVHQHLDLIAGLPFEDFQSFRHSFDEIFDLWPNQLQLGFLKVLKGSFMYEHAKEYGIAYHDKPPYEVLYTNWLSYGEVLRIKRVEEMLETYYNSGQYEITMKILYAMYDSMFDFFLVLGEYYEKNNLLIMNHTRIRRCEILLDFLNAQGRSEEELLLLREALVMDLYYRENCKTRPSFAVDQSYLKDMTRKYCEKGKLWHVEPFHYAFPWKGYLKKGEVPQRLSEESWILFKYDERDCLNHQAGIVILQE